MKKRMITALAIILVVAIPVFFGGIPLEILALFVVAAGGYEWLHVVRQGSKWPNWILPFVVLLVLLSRWIPVQAYYAFLLLGLILLWALPVFYEFVTPNQAFALMAYFILFSMVYQSVGLLQSNHLYLVTICFATYGSDTGAYLVGGKWGKNKMNPRISPKKSWEGFFGGLILGCICAMGVSLFYLDQVNSVANVMLCILCPATAELGDLCFSAMKRSYGIKDFSDLLPGHGGVLDRIDSLIMNLMVFIIIFSFLF